jgi:hypothetical protein
MAPPPFGSPLTSPPETEATTDFSAKHDDEVKSRDKATPNANFHGFNCVRKEMGAPEGDMGFLRPEPYR